MKKVLPYIFILTVIVQLFAPFSVFQKSATGQKGISFEKNISFALEEQKIEADIKVNYTAGYDYIKIDGEVLEAGKSEKFNWKKLASEENYFYIVSYLYDNGGNLVKYEGDLLSKIMGRKNPQISKLEEDSQFQKTFKELEPNTTYKILTTLMGEKDLNLWTGTYYETSSIDSVSRDITTSSQKGEEIEQESVKLSGSQENLRAPDDVFDCSINNLRGCIAEGFYLILFKPTAFIFGLTGKALDFTLMYSLDDDSYRSVFVVEGWGIVRDICNIFFIFILLYIAFKVILGIGGKGDPKKLIINVVIVGLLINFSLFATRIIIDASNILSRVFYNSEVINLGDKNSTTGSLGEIRLSEALVNKVNPVELLSHPEKVEQAETVGSGSAYDTNPDAEDQGHKADDDNKNISDDLNISLSGFILVCILSAAICIAGTVVFFNLALVFIARVVMLWIAMILSPIAFFTNAVPELSQKPKIGFKNWLNETSSMAFVAPVFCFFMYIIISFLDSGLGLISAATKTNSSAIASGFDFVIGIAVPFAFLIALLMQTKKIAVSMSGDIGKSFAEAGGKIAGKTLGLAAGGASMAMRGTFGAIGTKIAGSKGLANLEENGNMAQRFLARNARNVGISLGNKSFDVRNTKLGQKAASGLGISDSVKGVMSSGAKPGVGIIGNREQRLKRIEENQAKRDKFKPQTEEEKDKEKLTEQQIRLENKNAVEIEKKEKEKEKAKEEYDEKTAEFKRTEDNRKVAEAEYNRSKGTADEAGKKKVLDDAREQEANALKERNEADAKLKKAREEVANINKGGKIVNIDGAGNHIVNKYNTTNGNITQEMYSKAQEKKREAEAEEAVALAEKQRLEGEKDDKILNIEAEERRKSAQATLVFDEEKQKAEEKRNNTVTLAEQSFDRQIGDEEAKLRDLTSQGLLTTSPQDLARINAEKAKITQKIKDLETNKTKQVSNIRTKADQEYNEMMKLITKNKTDQVAQASKEADEKRQAIIETVRTAGDRHTEAQNKTRVTTATANFAEEAKTYAESNGGFGKSSSDLKKEINELDSKIKQNTNEMTINRADHIPGSWMLTRDQVREKRSKIIESAKRK